MPTVVFYVMRHKRANRWWSLYAVDYCSNSRRPAGDNRPGRVRQNKRSKGAKPSFASGERKCAAMAATVHGRNTVVAARPAQGAPLASPPHHVCGDGRAQAAARIPLGKIGMTVPAKHAGLLAKWVDALCGSAARGALAALAHSAGGSTGAHAASSPHHTPPRWLLPTRAPAGAQVLLGRLRPAGAADL